jgi:hypothetical protein
MKKVLIQGVRATVLFAILLFALGPVSTQPVYADCANNDTIQCATQINSLTYSDTVNNSTYEIHESVDPVPGLTRGACTDVSYLDEGFRSAWYWYKPLTDETIQADTIGSVLVSDNSTVVDTYIVIWEMVGGTMDNPTLAFYDCNDDFDLFTSRFTWVGVQNTTYFIEVAQYGGPNSVGDPYPDEYAQDVLLKFNAHITNTDVYVGNALQERYYLYDTSVAVENYTGVFDGPVQVKNTVGDPIITTERTFYGSAFHETRGIPANELTTDYWFPWYDYKVMQTWISVGNPSGTETANVSIYIGGVFKESKSIAPRGRWTPYYPNVFNGPVQVKSTDILETYGGQASGSGIAILVSERTLYGQNFNETNGIRASGLVSEYWFPWYDYKVMQTWISIGNPSGTETAHVSVYIAGQFKESQNIAPNGRWVPYYPGVFTGPVQVKSTDVLETYGGQATGSGIAIIATERTLNGKSFNETPGIPLRDLTTEYWLPVYDSQTVQNGKTMQTWISVGNPSGTETANVSIYIGGVFKESKAIAPNGQWAPIYNGVYGGPLQVKSTDVLETYGGEATGVGQAVFVSTRTLLGKSFSETNGIPADQLVSEYWFTWYDYKYMQTWLSIAVP